MNHDRPRTLAWAEFIPLPMLCRRMVRLDCLGPGFGFDARLGRPNFFLCRCDDACCTPYLGTHLVEAGL